MGTQLLIVVRRKGQDCIGGVIITVMLGCFISGYLILACKIYSRIKAKIRFWHYNVERWDPKPTQVPRCKSERNKAL